MFTARVDVISGAVPTPAGKYSSANTATMSDDGRYVAFMSTAFNFDPHAPLGLNEVFVRDLQTGTTTAASVANDGSPANAASFNGSISGNGRYVVFQSGATNLVSGDTNGASDVFVRDLQAGTTTRVSVGAGGAQGNGASVSGSLSEDGTIVAFQSSATNLVSGDTNSADDIFVRNLSTGTTTMASIASDGTQGNRASTLPVLSGDGTKVVFGSMASNLVSGDSNGLTDAFVRDLSAGTTTRVDVTNTGGQAGGGANGWSISGDGNTVGFTTPTGLVAVDTNSASDVYVRSLTASTTTLVSIGTGNTVANSSSVTPGLSDDGNLVSFQSSASNLISGDTNGTADVFVRNLSAGTTVRVSLANDGSQISGGFAAQGPAISGDGTDVTFVSGSPNLVSGDVNNVADVFLRDTSASTTTRVDVGSSGQDGIYPANGLLEGLSTTGRYVAFQTDGSNLVSGDTNNYPDAFQRDVTNSSTSRVSVTGAGAQANGAVTDTTMSADGNSFAFTSNSTNLVSGDTNNVNDVFVRNISAGTTTRVSVSSSGGQANNDSSHPSLSSDGRYVAFVSNASNLVTGDTNSQTDVFVHDMTTGTTSIASVATAGTLANGPSGYPGISGDGRYVAFQSDASNLVSGDTNGSTDIFVHDMTAGTTARVSVASAGTQTLSSMLGSYSPAISGNGRYVGFSSDATNLVPGDTNGFTDVFVHDLQTGTTTRVSVTAQGAQATGGSSDNMTLSDDGSVIAFQSDATNLVAGDTNGVTDIFVADVGAGTLQRVSMFSDGTQSNGYSVRPYLSGDGRYVGFSTNATNIVVGDASPYAKLVIRSTMPLPTVASVSPSSGARGTELDVTVSGTGFIPGATVYVDNTKVTVTSTTYQSSTSVIAHVQIGSDATTGAVSVQVTNPGTIGPGTGASNFCTNCFTVT